MEGEVYITHIGRTTRRSRSWIEDERGAKELTTACVYMIPDVANGIGIGYSVRVRSARKLDGGCDKSAFSVINARAKW